jgi:hypothetical protein
MTVVVASVQNERSLHFPSVSFHDSKQKAVQKLTTKMHFIGVAKVNQIMEIIAVNIDKAWRMGLVTDRY